MKKNPGRRERRNLFFSNRRMRGQQRAIQNERNMKKAARDRARSK